MAPPATLRTSDAGHYEGTTFECLDAIGDGIRQAGVTVAAP